MENNRPPAVTFSQAFWFWLKLGVISFGGPAGQVATMHKELVERRRWISEGRFLHALNYCMLLPGPEATQLAVYIGWLLHGTAGGVAAGVLFVLPGALLLAGLSWLYVVAGGVGAAAGLLFGFKAAVVALVLGSIIRVGRRSVRTAATLAITILSFSLMTFTDVRFPVILLMAGALGAVGSRLRPEWFPAGGGSHAPGAAPPVEHAPALIDEHTPTPPHAMVRWPRLLRQALVFAMLLIGPLLALALWRGSQDVFSVMGRFFTLAAFVTVGGAYSVLPYVNEMATTVYFWLTPGQMMDGLALGETTPGPLILVLTFVGFLGGWKTLGVAGGMFGAGVATYFTFLPSFMFILLGGPFVERSRGLPGIGAIMAAISAAVVGVIGNLAVVFGRHVLMAEGFRVNIPACVLTLAAFAAMQRMKWSPALVIVACGAAGVALFLAGVGHT
jgi:chromate transporter